MIDAAGLQCILLLCDNRTPCVKHLCAKPAKDATLHAMRKVFVAKDPQKTYREWLRRGLKKPGKSQSGLARHLGLGDPSPINKVLASKRKLQLTELIAAAEYLQEPLPTDQPNLTVSSAPSKESRGIPIRSEVAAGLWLEVGALSEEPLGFAQGIEPIKGFPLQATYALRVRGNSVNKIAPPGALLVCVDLGLSGIEVKDGDLVIVQRTRSQGAELEVTAKRVRRVTGGVELIPESTDPRWKPISYLEDPEDDDTTMTIIARVEWAAIRP